MRGIFFLFFAVVPISLGAQHDTCFFKGKKYLQYPYKIGAESAESDTDERVSVYNGEIPPVLDSLPSGDYALLQTPNNTFRNRWKKRFGYLEPLVRATFSVSGGKINGTAFLYLTSGYIDKETNYTDGLKNGESRNIYFVGDSSYADVTHYKMGVLNGPFSIHAYEKNRIFVATQGTHVDGEWAGWLRKYEMGDSAAYLSEEYFLEKTGFSKHYRSFYANGKPMLEAYPDSVAEYNEEAPAYTRFMDGVVAKKQKKKMVEELINTSSKSFTPLGIPYVCYHANGSVMAKFLNDDVENIKFDTVFRSDGKPAFIKTVLPDTNGHERFSITTFSLDGSVFEKKTYAKDEQGVWESYEEYTRNEKNQLCLEKGAYYQLFRTNWKKQSKDSLLLYSVKNQNGVLKYEYVSPLMQHQHFIRLSDSAKKYSIDFTIHNYDSISAAYQTVLTCGKIQAVLYTFRDTSLMADKRFSSGEIFERLLRSPRGKGNYMDSLVLRYKGQLYTGRLDLRVMGSSDFVRETKRGLVLNPMAVINRPLRRREKIMLHGSYLRTQFVRGEIKSAKLKFQERSSTIVAEGDFKNSLPQGKVVGRELKRNRFGFTHVAGQAEIFLKDGLVDGSSKIWDYDETTRKRFLSKWSTHKNGLQIDTGYVFYSSGKPRSVKIFNKEGKLHGAQMNYNNNGEVESYSFFDNGKQQGLDYSVNNIGDSLWVASYFNDSLDGRYYAASVNEETFKIDHRTYAHFKSGKATGAYHYTDGFGVKRLQFNIDSSRVGEINRDMALSAWQTELTFAGEAQVFHPNGKLYAKGRMQMLPPVPVVDEEEDVEYADAVAASEGGTINPEMSKTGQWNYYNSVGRKQATVKYNGDSSYVIGKDTVAFGIGTYQAYYDNGLLKYEGVLLYEEELENCGSDIGLLQFVADYSMYLSPAGDTLVKNGQGHLQIFNDEGGIYFEGALAGAKKQGWWKEFNKEGKLVGVGQYVDGKKNGRWLSGDLSGFNYLDGGCYESDESKAQIAKAVQYNIEITEVMYENDVQKSSQQYQFTRSAE